MFANVSCAASSVYREEEKQALLSIFFVNKGEIFIKKYMGLCMIANKEFEIWKLIIPTIREKRHC